MTGPDPRPLLLVVGSGKQLWREYTMRSAASRYRLWLIDAKPPTWQGKYLVGSSTVDAMVIPDAVAAAEAVDRQHRVGGVFCYDEGLVWPSAHMAEAVGGLTNDPEVVRSCRDKHATRTILDGAGVGQARSICVATPEEAAAAADDIGYPVVLKPRGLGGSRGVIRVDHPADLRDAYADSAMVSHPGVPVYEAGILVEEYLDGPEISIDAVFWEGECHPMVVARKEVGFDPFFEEVGHVVLPDDPYLEDEDVMHVLRSAHEALGWRYGVTHTELKLTSRGPRLIEVNARLGGDLIPWLGWLARGIDCGLAAADVAAGRPPDVAATRSRVAGIAFLYPPEDCEVVAVEVRRELAHPAVHQVTATAGPGTVLRLPPNGYISRYGLVIAVADDEAACREALAGAERIVELRAVPLEDSRMST